MISVGCANGSTGLDTQPPASPDAGVEPLTPADDSGLGTLVDDSGSIPVDLDAGIDEEVMVEPPPPPSFPHFDQVIDSVRGSNPVWAHFIHVERGADSISFVPASYSDTADRNDFYPASAVKIYAATAAMVLLHEYGLSLDADATFYHHDGSRWVEDITRSVRDIIEASVRCSSNSDYTLLLRLAGLDWLHREFLVADNGFAHTAMTRGYNSSRPYFYDSSERQRIVLRDEGRTVEREHAWTGTDFDTEAGCWSSTCTTARELTENMRRIMFHGVEGALSDDEQYAIRDEDADWYRYGFDSENPVLGDKEQCGTFAWDGIQDVFPSADLYHKGGMIESVRVTTDYVVDAISGTEYFVAIGVNSTTNSPITKLSEAVARMARTPELFVTLASLPDYVNPITATATVYATTAGTLDLMIRPIIMNGFWLDGYSPLDGTSVAFEPGTNTYSLASSCLDVSETYDIVARVRPAGTGIETISELHYVISDSDVACIP